MREFYKDCNNGYQKVAQPYLDAVARGIRDKSTSRAFILAKTEFSLLYADAVPLWQEQWAKRVLADCPFWANCFYDPCQSCNCRIDGSKAMEVDGLFFLRNAHGKTIALHVEMKPDNDAFRTGQAEAYRPRATCYRDQRRRRKGVLPHDHFITILIYGTGTDIEFAKQHFDRLISHDTARKVFPGYPAG
jgi:hypothetical protein